MNSEGEVSSQHASSSTAVERSASLKREIQSADSSEPDYVPELQVEKPKSLQLILRTEPLNEEGAETRDAMAEIAHALPPQMQVEPEDTPASPFSLSDTAEENTLVDEQNPELSSESQQLEILSHTEQAKCSQLPFHSLSEIASALTAIFQTPARHKDQERLWTFLPSLAAKLITALETTVQSDAESITDLPAQENGKQTVLRLSHALKTSPILTAALQGEPITDSTDLTNIWRLILNLVLEMTKSLQDATDMTGLRASLVDVAAALTAVIQNPEEYNSPRTSSQLRSYLPLISLALTTAIDGTFLLPGQSDMEEESMSAYDSPNSQVSVEFLPFAREFHDVSPRGIETVLTMDKNGKAATAPVNPRWTILRRNAGRRRAASTAGNDDDRHGSEADTE
jgi:hypothetical protein